MYVRHNKASYHKIWYNVNKNVFIRIEKKSPPPLDSREMKGLKIIYVQAKEIQK